MSSIAPRNYKLNFGQSLHLLEKARGVAEAGRQHLVTLTCFREARSNALPLESSGR